MPTLSHHPATKDVYSHTCNTCHRARPLTDFYQLYGQPMNKCADCLAKSQKNYLNGNRPLRDHFKQKSAEYHRKLNEKTAETAINQGKRYTRDELIFIEQNHQHLTAFDMAIMLGRTRASVNSVISKLDLRKTIARPAHREVRNHLTGSTAAKLHDKRAWSLDDDIVLYKNQNNRSIHAWSVYLERTEGTILKRIKQLNQHPPI